jgi:hypothetical protein
MKKMELVEKVFDLQTRFCSFLVRVSPEEVTELAKKGSKVT